MGELEKMDLGGQLELRWLENAKATDANAANLSDKKGLEELILRWSHDHGKETDKEVLEGLRPHDGLKAMRMYCCGSSGIPTWMLELHGMVDLKLDYCQNLEKLPALWQLPSLQFLYLSCLQNLHCLFSGGAPSKFQKLKRMTLWNMPKFETWWDTNVVQGEEPFFPEVEYLEIEYCKSLTALPKASMVKQSSSKDDTRCRSAFPALREMHLNDLKKFHRWEPVDGSLGEQVTFPQLEKLEIRRCSQLTTFPEGPKLSTLELRGCNEEASLQAASKYISSLSSLILESSQNSDYNKEENSIEVVVRDHEPPSPLGDLVLQRCDLFFSHSSASKLWNCFGQLSKLEISFWDGLVYWPENLFQGLVSLRTLKIRRCNKLTGNTKEEEASDEQPAPEQSGSLPRLESLVIEDCGSLVQVPNMSASLKTLHIERCKSLKSIAFSGAGAVQQLGTSSSLIAAGSSSNEDESTVSTAVLKLSSSSASNNHCFFPHLESLEISDCGGLTEVASLPPSIKTLKICRCSSLVSVSGEFTSLEELLIVLCDRLESLPSGPHQVYSSLRDLRIINCDGIKQFPPSLHLQQCVNHLDEEDLDQHLEEQVELDSKPESMSDGASTSVVLKQSSSTSSNQCFFPFLESLYIYECNGLIEIANLPPSIKTLKISDCSSLVSLCGEFPTSLEKLKIVHCQSLESLPNGHRQSFSSLRVLRIKDCDGLKQLPPSLQQCLDHLKKKDLDPHLLQGFTGRIASLVNKLERIASLVNKLECFRSTPSISKRFEF